MVEKIYVFDDKELNDITIEGLRKLYSELIEYRDRVLNVIAKKGYEL